MGQTINDVKKVEKDTGREGCTEIGELQEKKERVLTFNQKDNMTDRKVNLVKIMLPTT